jgi:HK97 family phage major capsid protein
MSTITESQLASKRAQLDQESAALDAELAQVVSTKAYSALPGIEARINELSELRSELDRQDSVSKAAARHPLAQFGGSAADEHQDVTVNTKAGTGRAVSPLAFSEASLKGLHAAASTRQSLTVKAFANVAGLLPAQLAPGVLGPIHENRLLDRLPATPISAPSYEYIRHSSSTGTPGVTAEGAAKPEVTLVTSSQIATVVKLAAHFGISHEALSDFPTFLSYAHTEMTRQIQDVENSELLNGSGTGGHLQGLMLTTGALTHTVATETALDAIEMSIAQLRVGSSLAEANLLVLHPATWSALRRSKDTQGRYLVNPDPTAADGQRIWDVDVLVTTTQAAGAGLLLDTSKFGRVLVREGITVATGTNTDDFSKNIQRWVIEERLALAIERPTALLTIAGLPTS